MQVFTPYQGRIIALFASVGDDVKKGQTLFTIDSPDLLQAESTLIAAAGVQDLNSKNLARLRDLFTTRAVSQRDVEQATSDEQTAEGNLRAARDAVRLFGKTDADIDRIVAAAQCRLDAGRAEPDRRPHHRAQRGAGPVRAAGQRAGALYGRRHRHHVDAGECRGRRQPGVSRRAAGAGQARCVSGSGL